jgi:SAM-dependent methyltransferase
MLPSSMYRRLVCPATGSKLVMQGNHLHNTSDPGITYPILDGIPILISDAKSLFLVADFVQHKTTTLELSKRGGMVRGFTRLIPDISSNIKAEQNYRQIVQMLPANAKVLIIGGGVQGQGMEAVYQNRKQFEIVGSDVSFGPDTDIICDAHDIPFESDTFDCVIAQAVLEHVLEPRRCVDEIHRVLKAGGLVYAETPFMQQVHMKQYDFTRFTHLGHRRLFRWFEEIDSGPCCGPGMALSWSYTYFLRSFASSKAGIRYLTFFARCTSFFLKYFDYYLIGTPGAYDGSSGFYFLGRRADSPLSDKSLLLGFKGASS